MNGSTALSAERWQQIKNILADALACGDDTARRACVERSCAGDEDLRREVDSFLECETDGLEKFADGVETRSGVSVDSLANVGQRLGAYELVREIGRGGMGTVYLARRADGRFEQQVAVKLLKRGTDTDEVLRRFRAERRILARLEHPGIARLLDGGETDEGLPFFVMEYVAGVPLTDFAREHGLPVPARLELFIKVCTAVQFAHQNFVVHRDLKPGNILVTIDGEPKLLDFGLARLLGPSDEDSPALTITLAESRRLTPAFASPEQVRGAALTTASDVYSLGALLYELLTDQPPHRFSSPHPPPLELLRVIGEQEPPRPSLAADAASRSRLRGDLDNIIGLAMRKEPARRYPSVGALADDLRRHLESRPVGARPDTWRYRAAKFIGRNKTGVAAGALVFLALMGGMIVTGWQASIALRERDRAHLAQRQAERLNGFLEQLLSSADPSRMGKDVKVAAVLDAASEKLDRELADEPEVLAAAHATLYRSYLHLGLMAPAEQQARAALAVLHRLHGPDDLAVVNEEIALATVLSRRSLPDEAEILVGHALKVLRRQPTPDHAALTEALNALSLSLYDRGQSVQAEPVVLETLTHARAAWGEESSGYAETLNRLGNIKQGEKEYAAAEPIFRHVIELQDRLAPGGERSVVPLVNLCVMLCYQEKWDEMKRMVDRLERDARRIYGEKSVYYAVAIYGHGVVDSIAGDYQAAIPLLQEALPILAATYAPGWNTLVQCRVQLGLCLSRTGQAAKGEPFLRAALADGGQIDRAEFAHTFGNLETVLGECLLDQKSYAEAEPLLLVGRDDLQKRLGSQNRLTLEADRRLRELYSAWSDAR